MWAQNLLPSPFQPILCPKFTCEHAPLIRFVIRPAGHCAITPEHPCHFISYLRSMTRLFLLPGPKVGKKKKAKGKKRARKKKMKKKKKKMKKMKQAKPDL